MTKSQNKEEWCK